MRLRIRMRTLYTILVDETESLLELENPAYPSGLQLSKYPCALGGLAHVADMSGSFKRGMYSREYIYIFNIDH